MRQQPTRQLNFSGQHITSDTSREAHTIQKMEDEYNANKTEKVLPTRSNDNRFAALHLVPTAVLLPTDKGFLYLLVSSQAEAVVALL